MSISSLSGTLALIGFTKIAGPAASRAEQAVDLEPVLAVDVSGGIDAGEARLQRDGYVQAVLSPQVVGAIQAGYRGRIAVVYFEWAGLGYTRTIVDWTVIDISCDGVNNHGRLVTLSRDEAVAAGITVNGLPIVNDRPGRFGRPPIPNLDLYYRDCVIGGRSAFILVANSFTDFARAIRRKLILEIAVATPAGERRWQQPIDES